MDYKNKIVQRLNARDIEKFVVLWNQESKVLTSSNFKMTKEKALDAFQKRKFDYYGLYEWTELIGFILINEEENIIWLKHMIIDKQFRIKGLGSYFLNEVLKQYNQEKLCKTEVLLNNSFAKAFFEKNGFTLERVDGEEKQYILKK